MPIKFKNNAYGTLSAGITDVATSISLTTGHGANFPSLGTGEFFYTTLVDTSNNLEIVKVTARSTDTLTVTRAQEGTTGRAYSTGDRLELRPTAGGMDEFIQRAGGPGYTLLTLTDGATISWDAGQGNVFQVTLAGNRTMAAPTSARVGNYVLKVVQDATGSRTITWNSVFKWPLGTAPTLSTAANAVDLFSFFCDGTNFYGSMLKGLA